MEPKPRLEFLVQVQAVVPDLPRRDEPQQLVVVQQERPRRLLGGRYQVDSLDAVPVVQVVQEEPLVGLPQGLLPVPVAPRAARSRLPLPDGGDLSARRLGLTLSICYCLG